MSCCCSSFSPTTKVATSRVPNALELCCVSSPNTEAGLLMRCKGVARLSCYFETKLNGVTVISNNASCGDSQYLDGFICKVRSLEFIKLLFIDSVLILNVSVLTFHLFCPFLNSLQPTVRHSHWFPWEMRSLNIAVPLPTSSRFRSLRLLFHLQKSYSML